MPGAQVKYFSYLTCLSFKNVKENPCEVMAGGHADFLLLKVKIPQFYRLHSFF